MISKAHNVIFVHIPKTGGQSIESIFLKSLGLEWKDRASLLLRFNPDRDVGPERLAHLFAHEYDRLKYTNNKEFSDFFSFSIVRNPYDRAVSEFNFRNPKRYVTIKGFYSSIRHDDYRDLWRHVCPQVHYLFDTEKEKIMVNELIYFETLEDQWAAISEKIFGRIVAIPHRNRAKTQRLSADDLGKEDIEYINNLYRDDFEKFGYEMR